MKTRLLWLVLASVLSLGAWVRPSGLGDVREIRSYGSLPSGRMEEAGRLGCRAQELNDHRAALIQQVNELFGQPAPPEKV